MLRWLRTKPKCPVSWDDKTWVENGFTWLTNELGIDRLQRGTLVLPTTDFFPPQYHGTEEELDDLLNRVGELMGVDSERLRLNVYVDEHPRFEGTWNEGTVGLYSESDGYFDIWLEVAILQDPLAVVATMAHEIGHVVLLGQRRVSPNRSDHEQLTDLVTVFLGLGILTANAVIHEDYWHSGHFSGWSMGRRGYLTMDVFGYALALYAVARGELKPAWLSHLRPDVRTACRNGIRYVTETGECHFSFPEIETVDSLTSPAATVVAEEVVSLAQEVVPVSEVRPWCENRIVRNDDDRCSSCGRPI